MLHPYRITYDIERFLSKEQLPEGTDKVTYTSRHKLLSVSICSNVPGHDTPIDCKGCPASTVAVDLRSAGFWVQLPAL